MSDSRAKYLELMHAELDGEATDKERMVLREYLASHPEAQNDHAELVKLTDLLNQVEEVETPGDLHASILAALPPRRPVREIGMWKSQSRFRIPLIRYGYALAAGLLLGAALTGVAFRSLSPVDKSNVYGTLAVRENAPRYVALGQMKLDSPGLEGSVELSRAGSNSLIVFNLQAQQAVEVEVGFEGNQVGLKSFDQQPGATQSLEAKEGGISFQSKGQQRSTVILTSEKAAPLILDLKFYVDGKLIHQGRLGAQVPGEF
ncbi:MAG TPA: hypothetical protein VFI95_14580 [Terriglobales bacterium]|nr:hypothetical protein [Terriglobales bacterium]